MIKLNCPVCGPRLETEFTYGADATVQRPEMTNDTMQDWVDYVFMRDNPRGWHREYWHHVQGRRQWLVVERGTLTHDVGACRLARDASDTAQPTHQEAAE